VANEVVSVVENIFPKKISSIVTSTAILYVVFGESWLSEITVLYWHLSEL
jgi:hypothetical protein